MNRYEKLSAVMDEISAMVSDGTMKKLLSGRGGNFRSTAPKNNGAAKYIHRMIQFSSGINVHMPVMASFDLQDYIDEKFPENKALDLYDEDKLWVCGLRTDERINEFFKFLDNIADEYCTEFGYDNMMAARRWARAMGF